MTKDDFLQLATPAIRHGLTALAGVLAAKGFVTADGAAQVVAFGGSVCAAAVALAWSFAEKNRLVASLVEAAPVSDIEQVAQSISDFKANGASPLLVAHLSQTLAAIAGAELQALQPPPPPEPAPNVVFSAAPSMQQAVPAVAGGPFTPAELQQGDGA